MPLSKLAWLAYCGIFLAVSIAIFIGNFSFESGYGLAEYIVLCLEFFLVLGVLGQVYQKAIGRRFLWKSLCILFVCWLLGLFILAMQLILFNVNEPWLAIRYLLGAIVLLLPSQYQLYRYAFKSQKIWESKKAPTHLKGIQSLIDPWSSEGIKWTREDTTKFISDQ